MVTSSTVEPPGIAGLRCAAWTISSGAWLALLFGGLASVCADLQRDVHPVVGTVAVDGVVPVGAQLRFHPLSSNRCVEAAPAAVVAEDGSFRVTTLGLRDGAPAGRYAVTIQWQPPALSDDGPAPGRNVLPSRYASARVTPLEAVIAAGHNELPEFALTCRYAER